MALIGNILLWALAAACLLAGLLLTVFYIRGAFRWRPSLHVENAIAPQDSDFTTAFSLRHF
ncbi:MAG: hypothetical protein AAF810_06230 [Cyanobacteria bacterium P01_D01_bin.36]